MDQIFDFMIRDFSAFALQLYSKTSSTAKQMDLCMRMIKKPVSDSARFDRVWQTHVYALKGAYRMNE
jgi:acyl-CoA dehydrogenase